MKRNEDEALLGGRVGKVALWVIGIVIVLGLLFALERAFAADTVDAIICGDTLHKVSVDAKVDPPRVAYSAVKLAPHWTTRADREPLRYRGSETRVSGEPVVDVRQVPTPEHSRAASTKDLEVDSPVLTLTRYNESDREWQPILLDDGTELFCQDPNVHAPQSPTRQMVCTVAKWRVYNVRDDSVSCIGELPCFTATVLE